MAEFLYATAHLAGTFVNPANAVGNTPGTWAGELNTNVSVDSRWSLGDPVDPLAAGATHTVQSLWRKGSNSNSPTVSVELWENGVFVKTLATDAITSTTFGQTLTGTFTTGQVTNPAALEVRAVMTAIGGSPSSRNSAQVAYFEWEAVTAAAAVQGSGAASLALAASAGGVRTARATGAAALALGASATGQRTTAATGAASLALAATGDGGVPSGLIEGTGAAALSLAAVGSGTRIVEGSGAAATAVTASADGVRTVLGSGAAATQLAATAQGRRTVTATGAAVLTLAAFAAPGGAPPPTVRRLLLLGCGQ